MLHKAEEFSNLESGIIVIHERIGTAIMNKFCESIQSIVNELLDQICPPDRRCIADIGSRSLIMRDGDTSMHKAQLWM
jgi:hypothetical protein